MISAAIVIESYYYTTGVQIGFGIAHGVLAKVENGRRQHRVSTTYSKTLIEVLQAADTT